MQLVVFSGIVSHKQLLSCKCIGQHKTCRPWSDWL